jgi:hypothetical protein
LSVLATLAPKLARLRRTEVATTIANQLPADLDAPLAKLALNNQPGGPTGRSTGCSHHFHGIISGHIRPNAPSRAGHAVTAAILDARAHGPRTRLT